MIVRQIKVGTSVIPLFRILLIGKFINFLYYFNDSTSSLMSKGQSKGQKIEICFLSNTVKELCNTSFAWDFDW